MSISNGGMMIRRENLRNSERNLPQLHFVNYDPDIKSPRLNQRLRGEKQAPK
jgi:hypothetical protein